MTIISKRTIATALSAIVLSTSVATTFNISSAEAGMREQNLERVQRGHRGHRRHGGHFNRDMAVGAGIFGALAIIGAIQAAPPAVPGYVKRRCAQYAEWRELVEEAKDNARIQLARGDQQGADDWLRSARHYAKKADEARRDCESWR